MKTGNPDLGPSTPLTEHQREVVRGKRGGGRQARVKYPHPIDWYAARGKLLTHQIDAARRYELDKIRALGNPNVTMKMDDAPRSNVIEIHPAAAAALKRCREIESYLPRDSVSVLHWVVLDGGYAEDWANKRGYPKKKAWGMVELRFALDLVSNFYAGQAGRIVLTK